MSTGGSPRGSTVVVTGAAGSLAAGVVRRLARGSGVRRVVALDVVVPEPCERVVPRLVDVRDARLARTFRGADVVVHLAGRHHPDTPAPVRRAVNVAGTANVLHAAADAGVGHVVLMTSAMVYGAAPDNPVPLDESAPLRAARDDSLVGDFVEVERLAEHHRAAVAGTTVTVLRPVTLVGAGADSVLTRHFESPRLLVVRGTTPLWQFVHVDDVRAAIELAALCRFSGAVNVAPDGWLTQDQVERISGKRRVELPPAVAFAAAERLHRAGVTRAPASELAYVAHPWVVSAARLRAAGWAPAYGNEAALRAQLALAGDHLAVAARRLGREDATRAAAGATVALLASAAVVRRARRRRR